MRKIFLLTILISFIAASAGAQVRNSDPNIAPTPIPAPAPPPPPVELPKYQKDPAMPEFKIMLMDSVTAFNTKEIPKGRKTLFVIFSPDCHHCKEFTRKMLDNIDSLKGLQIYMVTPIRNLGALRNFYSEFNLQNYPNIKVVGQDTEFFIMDFFAIRNFPTAILYDEHKKLVKEFGRDPSIIEISDGAR